LKNQNREQIIRKPNQFFWFPGCLLGFGPSLDFFADFKKENRESGQIHIFNFGPDRLGPDCSRIFCRFQKGKTIFLVLGRAVWVDPFFEFFANLKKENLGKSIFLVLGRTDSIQTAL